MRTLHLIVLTLTLAGCPKQQLSSSQPAEDPALTQLLQVEAQTARLYERFVDTCEAQVMIGYEEWFLNCTQSLGRPVPGYPQNTCSNWNWVNQGVLTRERWATKIVDLDRERSQLGTLWEQAPVELRTNEATEARGMNPWIMNPRWPWECPPLPEPTGPPR